MITNSRINWPTEQRQGQRVQECDPVYRFTHQQASKIVTAAQLVSTIQSLFESFFRFARRKQIVYRLKMEHQSLKTL